MDNYEGLQKATEEDAASMVGKTYIERSDYYDIATGRTTPAPQKVWTIIDARPAGDDYYRVCPETQRRVECTLVRTRNGKTSKPQYRWLTPEDVQ